MACDAFVLDNMDVQISKQDWCTVAQVTRRLLAYEDNLVFFIYHCHIVVFVLC
jgi:hypothetical protein